MIGNIGGSRARRLSLLGVSLAAIGWAGVADAQEAAAAASGSQVEEVVVTGSLLRRRQEDVATPLVTVGAEQIKQAGVLNVGDLTRYIPQNIGSAGGVQDLAKGGADSHDARSANLRGLGAGATLVLLNGRRVVPAEGFVNLNSLTPSIAISRVETALGGASAIYGSDAVAGVVNIITNNRFQGFDMTGQYLSMDKAGDYQIQARMGAGSERFHVVGSVAYTYQEHLQNGDRAITNFYNPSSGTGGNPGTFTMSARPQTAAGGNLVIGGHDYSALYDQYKNAAGVLTVVDPGCGSAATQSVFTPAANGPGWGLGTCAFSYQAQNPLRPRSQSLVTHTDASFDITDRQQLYMEFAAYHQDSDRYGVPSFAQNHNAGPGPIVPVSNPYNIFGVPVQFTGRAIGAQGFGSVLYKQQRDELNQFHTVLGSKGSLFGDWTYDTSATWSRASTFSRDRDTDMNLFQDALNGYGGPNCNIRWNGPGPGAVAGQGNCLYLSPFAADAKTQKEDLLFNIQNDNYYNNIRESVVAEGVINGDLFTLPAGKVPIAVGAQFRREMQRSVYSDLIASGFGGFQGPSRNTVGARKVKSVFAETSIPVIEGLNVDLAVRHEDYGNFKTTSPKIEGNYKLFDNRLALRASFGKSFQAPGIENATASQIGTAVGNVTDPLNGNTTFRTIVTLGNPALRPQTAKAYNLGFTVIPVDRASVSLDWWTYKYENRIQTQNAQAVINADPRGSQVVRDANGVAQTVYVLTFNAPSGTATSGLDLQASYSMDALGGTLTFRNVLSYLLKYDIDTGSGIYDGIGRRNNATTSPGTAAAAPRVRNVLSLDWRGGSQSFGVNWRYSSRLSDDYLLPLTTTPTDHIKAWSVVDFQYGVRFGEDDRYEVNAGMINVFDTAPGFAKFTGYLPSVSDALGRQTYVRLGVHF